MTVKIKTLGARCFYVRTDIFENGLQEGRSPLERLGAILWGLWLKELEAENTQMQRIIARQTVEIHAIEQLMRKNSWGLPGEPKP